MSSLRGALFATRQSFFWYPPPRRGRCGGGAAPAHLSRAALFSRDIPNRMLRDPDEGRLPSSVGTCPTQRAGLRLASLLVYPERSEGLCVFKTPCSLIDIRDKPLVVQTPASETAWRCAALRSLPPLRNSLTSSPVCRLRRNSRNQLCCGTLFVPISGVFFWVGMQRSKISPSVMSSRQEVVKSTP